MQQTVDVLRAKGVPFEAALTPKAGSRLLMNLMYYINAGEYYHDIPAIAERIADCDELNWARSKPLRPGQRTTRAAIIRHPANRFCALYFENILPKQGLPENWFNRLKQMKFNYEAQGLKAHQKNALILLDFIEEKVKEHGLYSISDWIVPQVKFALPAQDIGAQIVIYARANIAFGEMLDGHVRDAEAIVTHIMEALYTPWLFARREFISGAVGERVHEIYAIDVDFFEAIRYGST